MTGKTPTYGLFIVRFAAEMSTKSGKTRSAFSRVLTRNILAAMARADLRARVIQSQGRMFVLASDRDRAEAQLGRIFGIGTFSPVEARCAADLDTLAATAEAHFSEAVKGRRYAVRTKRRGRHPFRSRDVEVRVGAALNPYGTVHLDNPDVTVHVEITGNRAYLFTRRIPGAAGLPVGTGGRALALLSGGFDSAVAAWSVMRRGLAVDFLFCNLAGAAYERQVLQVAKVLTELWAAGISPRLWVVDFNAAVAELRARVEPRYWQIVLKRLMYRAASRIARQTRAGALVTGESLAQVSSQTLSNLAAIEPGADCLVLRPLIAREKREIMDEARCIGTAPLSERIPEFCALTDQLPAVRSSAGAIDAEEAKLDASILERAIGEARCVELAALKPEELRTDYLFVAEPPEDAEIIDLRPPRLYARGHLPGAVNRAPEEVLARLRSLDKRRVYVLDCAFGTVSAQLAEVMQQFGYQAYALRSAGPAEGAAEQLEAF